MGYQYQTFFVPDTEAEYNARNNANGTNDYLDYIVPTKAGWYSQTYCPGCLPEDDPVGPFDTEDEAQASIPK
jgi:hypothetical protein